MIDKIRSRVSCAVVGLLLIASCRRDSGTEIMAPIPNSPMKEPPMATTTDPVKVWVFQNGAIELDGVKATLGDVKRAFEMAAKAGVPVL